MISEPSIGVGAILRPQPAKDIHTGMKTHTTILRAFILNLVKVCYKISKYYYIAEESIMSFWKKKDNLIITGFVVLFFVGLGTWCNMGCVRAAFFPSATPTSAFEVPFLDQNQNQLTLSKFIGKPLVVNIWATWCPVCVKKMGGLNRFAQKFKEKGGEVLAISQDRGGITAIRAFYARNGYTNLPIYIEAEGRLLEAFGGRGLPTSIFIDKQGRVIKIYTGINGPATGSSYEKWKDDTEKLVIELLKEKQ